MKALAVIGLHFEAINGLMTWFRLALFTRSNGPGIVRATRYVGDEKVNGTWVMISTGRRSGELSVLWICFGGSHSAVVVVLVRYWTSPVVEHAHRPFGHHFNRLEVKMTLHRVRRMFVSSSGEIKVVMKQQKRETAQKRESTDGWRHLSYVLTTTNKAINNDCSCLIAQILVGLLTVELVILNVKGGKTARG
jgi:hypothetical protein